MKSCVQTCAELINLVKADRSIILMINDLSQKEC